MKYTLLELTQAILSSMDSDEVNTISDTVESLQVVKVIKTVYDDIISRGGLKSNKVLFSLTASGDNLKPVLMTKPASIDTIEWVRYNKVLNLDTDTVWSDIRYLTPVDFITFVDNYSLDDPYVSTMSVTLNGFTNVFHFRTDTPPQYFTSFNDNTLIFDAYDSEVDTTLQSLKTRCYGTLASDFEEEDDFVPSLQPNQFALLLNEAKSLAWAELKQQQHPKAEQTARRNWRHLQKTRQQVTVNEVIKDRSHHFNSLPNFARRP